MAFLHVLRWLCCHQQRTTRGEDNEGVSAHLCLCVCVCPFAYSSPNGCTSPGAPPCTHTHTHALKNHFPPVWDCSHVGCVSIRRQEWLVISQGSDSQNGPSGTLCHSAWVRACPIDPAQLSKPMRDARLRSSRDGLCCQGLWMMYNIRMVFVL